MLDDDWQLTLDQSEKFVLADDAIDNKIKIHNLFCNIIFLHYKIILKYICCIADIWNGEQFADTL